MPFLFKMPSSSTEWNILLYYQYVPIQYPEKFAKEHLQFCKSLGLKGRILVAAEGINGTVGGPKEATDEYIRIMRQDERFKNTDFKISVGQAGTFKKMFVRARPELVTLNIKEKIDPNTEGGIYLKPEELKQMYDKDEDFVIIDMRNDYEAKIGRFKNAVTLKMKVFKELPRLVEDLKVYKNKKVVTYCTGGIRCEKASALLKKRGFSNVYQLQGGVARYGEKFPNDYWEGKLFVFDERMQIPINTPESEKVIAQCMHCGKPWDQYTNCINALCNKLILSCPACQQQWNSACSEECAKNPRTVN